MNRHKVLNSYFVRKKGYLLTKQAEFSYVMRKHRRLKDIQFFGTFFALFFDNDLV